MSSQPSSEAAPARGALANIFANLGWIVSGKGFGAICSLIYLAIMARSLGIREFGHFSLIFGTGQALVALASFQTWQTLVKFGANAVHEKDWDRFGRLAWLCGSIDFAGALAGCLIAYIVYYGLGGVLELNPDYIDMAFAFNCALLFARMTTPNGIVRVLNRFDIGTFVEAIVPAGRLIASIIILFMGGTVGKFLFAWALFDVLSTLIYWIAAWRLAPQALQRRHIFQFRKTLSENPGLPTFFGITFASSTLDACYKQGPLLAVGYFLGTSAAGLYRLAEQLAQGIGKLSGLIGRAVFPEFAMAQTASDPRSFGKLVRQVTAMAGVGGLVVTLVSFFFGEFMLTLIGGSAFSAGAIILMPLVIGAAFELASVSYEPVLYSTGHATYPLMARAASLIVLVIGILAMVGMGPIGVAWAVALGLAASYALMTATVWLVLRSLSAKPTAA